MDIEFDSKMADDNSGFKTFYIGGFKNNKFRAKEIEFFGILEDTLLYRILDVSQPFLNVE